MQIVGVTLAQFVGVKVGVANFFLGQSSIWEQYISVKIFILASL